MAELARIRIYPFKALDPLELPAADVLPSGALKLDRAFAIVDADGKFVNGKRIAAVHGLRATFSADATSITVHAPARPELGSATASLPSADYSAFEAWLSRYFGFATHIQHNGEVGFPDDHDAPGPTLISTATLEAVAAWFPGLSVESARLRFRANLEIAGVPEFWEDRLFSAQKGLDVAFRIGAARFWGSNPCQRCIVPTRDAESGAQWPEFQKIFMDRRKAALPEWAASERFNHYYRLALNTLAAAGTLRVGDAVTID